VHEFSGGDARALSAIGELCLDLSERIAESSVPVPVLPSGGGTAAKLDKAHLPYVQCLHAHVLAAARMGSASGGVECARGGGGGDDEDSSDDDGSSARVSESDDSSGSGGGGGMFRARVTDGAVVAILC
jgi:hypothetical protein